VNGSEHPGGVDRMKQASAGDATYHWVYLILSAIVLTLAVALDVSSEGRVIVPVLDSPLPESCVFKQLTSVDCPGCGLTRCFICLMHGDIARAWAFNPGGFLFFVVIAGQIPYRMIQIWRMRHRLEQWHPVTLSTAIGCSLGVVLIGQWIWRTLS